MFTKPVPSGKISVLLFFRPCRAAFASVPRRAVAAKARDRAHRPGVPGRSREVAEKRAIVMPDAIPVFTTTVEIAFR